MKAIEALVPLIVIASFASSFARAESGTMEMVGSAVQTMQTVQIGDTTVAGAYGAGTVTILKSSGGPFTAGSSGAIKCVRTSKKTPSSFELEANCIVNFSSTDSFGVIFKRRAGDVVAGTSGEGTEEITSGTGKFAGISASCKYQVTTLAGEGTWNVTHSQCQWRQ